jgi:hypothetical protein
MPIGYGVERRVVDQNQRSIRGGARNSPEGRERVWMAAAELIG